MIFTLTLNCSGSAFEEPAPEVVRLLREVADRIDDVGALPIDAVGPLLDINGNRCGQWATT